jgi:hypothetical protein
MQAIVDFFAGVAIFVIVAVGVMSILGSIFYDLWKD